MLKYVQSSVETFKCVPENYHVLAYILSTQVTFLCANIYIYQPLEQVVIIQEQTN